MPNIQHVREILQAYTGDMDSLNLFTAAATETFGTDWAQHIFDDLADLPEDEKEKLNHAFQYYAALTAWEEIQAYLAQTTPLNPKEITERIPILAHWLAFFGESGEKAVNQLSEKLSTQTVQPFVETPISEDMPQTEEEENDKSPNIRETTEENSEQPPVSPQKAEPVWIVEKIFKQMELTQNVQAWIVARCIELGNIEIFAYPYYGFLIDLMQQTLNDIKSLLSDTSLFDNIESSYTDGIKKLQTMQISLERDLEIAEQNGVSAETSLLRENLNRDAVQQALGRLDTSDQPEYLGPAPDGFELLVDPYDELDENPIKAQYHKIENVVLSKDTQSVPENTIKEKEDEKISSQTQENGVKRKLSFSLGNKNKPTVS